MATWTLVKTLDNTGDVAWSFCVLGTNIYYILGTTLATRSPIYEYNTITDTVTQISAVATADYAYKITVFRDRLYGIVNNDLVSAHVHRWNGAIGDFSQVVDISLSDLGGSKYNLYAHGGYLVAVAVGTNIPIVAFVGKHTTNGTAWTTSSISVAPRTHHAGSAWDEKTLDVEFPTWLGIAETFRTDNNATTPIVRDVVQFSQGVWTVLAADVGGTEWAQSSGPGIWWANYQVGDKWTKDFVSFTTPAGSVTAAHTFNLPATSWGVSDSTVTRSIYRFDGTAWVLLETIVSGSNWRGADRTTFIRIGDDIYMIGEPTATATTIYKRDEPLPSGRFYYGQGKLVRRSDAPILSTNPGGLALMGKTLLAGSSVNSEVMVGYADEPTYEAWTDYTGTLSKTAPIKSFSATPWGDSEDLEASEDAVEGGGFQGGTGGRCS